MVFATHQHHSVTCIYVSPNLPLQCGYLFIWNTASVICFCLCYILGLSPWFLLLLLRVCIKILIVQKSDVHRGHSSVNRFLSSLPVCFYPLITSTPSLPTPPEVINFISFGISTVLFAKIQLIHIYFSIPLLSNAKGTIL